MLAIVAVIAAQGALAICQCRIAAALEMIDSPVKADCCERTHEADEGLAGSCCTPSSEDHPDCPGCTCSAPPVMALPTSELAVDHEVLAPLTLLAANWSASILEFNSSIVAELVLPANPSGVRLHALLCVWRN